MSKLLSVRETAKFFSVSPSTIRKWIQAGELGCIHIGDVFRVSEEHITEFVRANEKQRAAVTA